MVRITSDNNYILTLLPIIVNIHQMEFTYGIHNDLEKTYSVGELSKLHKKFF